MPANTKKRPHLGPGRLSAEAMAELPDRLLDAAFDLFKEQGFSDTSMDQIARRAGASTKTIYNRFANKAEILEQVVGRNVQRTVADHLRGFALRPEESEPREFLFKFALQIGLANLHDETSGLQRVTFAEANRFPILRRTYHDVTGRGINAIANGLRLWRDMGKLDFDLDPQLAATLFFCLTTHEVRIRSILGEPMTRNEVERFVGVGTDLFLRGLVSSDTRRAKPSAAKRAKKRPNSSS